MNLIKTKLKKGDNVLVISGKEKGKTGSIFINLLYLSINLHF